MPAMTRILYWNIRNFTLAKIFSTAAFPAPALATSRLDHILDDVISPNPPAPGNPPPAPDMIIVAECYSRVKEVSYQGGALNPPSTVGRAILMLLDEIRNSLGNMWCVVPPLMLGDLGIREAVAVFYNAATLTFTGPYVYALSNGLFIGRPATPANLAAIRDYTLRWLDGLPSPVNPEPALQLNRTWNAPNGAAVNECHGAGQWEHRTAGGARINFPYLASRSPFYTRMLDIAGGRTIKVFTVHTSPAAAAGGTSNIANIPQLALAAGEVGVVVGDFNVDSFDMAVNGAYAPILNLGYDMLLDPRHGVAVNTARRPYCLTHLLPDTLATPWNTVGVAADPRHNVYPRFGYMGSTAVPHGGGAVYATDAGSIDNVLIGYPAGVAPPAHHTTIVNTVVGKPYTAGPVPAGVGPELTGGYDYDSSLAVPIPAAGRNPAAGMGAFATWMNFGRIASVSDHLAVLFEV
jgi:hypothetical protein